MKYALSNHNPAAPRCYRFRGIRAALLLIALLPLPSPAEFSLNFQNNPNVISSVANVSCNNGDGGGMMDGMGGMGGMGNIGPGCGADSFIQELVDDNGTQYYHVILSDATQDFAMEFYIRSAGCCWFSGGGMMGGGGMMDGGGDAPYSSSDGDTNDRLANAFQPLAGAATSGSGTGNPTRIYMRQINNGGGMNQEFTKGQENRKPRITQTINDGATQMSFALDMSNGGYGNFTSPASFTNTLTLNQPDGVGDFDMNSDAPQRNTTAGLYSYIPGNGFGGSSGSYDYVDQGFDVLNTDWLAFCDPDQNPDNQCQFSAGGGGGGGMMGM